MERLVKKIKIFTGLLNFSPTFADSQVKKNRFIYH